MCWVWTSLHTAIISPYSINFPIFTTESLGVYYAVRAGALTQVLLCFSRDTLPDNAHW